MRSGLCAAACAPSASGCGGVQLHCVWEQKQRDYSAHIVVQTFSLHVQVENLHYNSNHLHPSSRPSLAIDHLPPLFRPHPRPKSNRPAPFDFARLVRVMHEISKSSFIKTYLPSTVTVTVSYAGLLWASL